MNLTTQIVKFIGSAHLRLIVWTTSKYFTWFYFYDFAKKELILWKTNALNSMHVADNDKDIIINFRDKSHSCSGIFVRYYKLL